MELALSQVQTDQELIFVCVGNRVSRPERMVGMGRMMYLPFVSDVSRLVLWYQAADVYIHAAREDNFPNTVLEALACGTPVVATAVGGIPEQIDDGVTGFLVPKGDSQAMAQRVTELLTNNELRLRMGQQAAETAKQRFGLERQVNEYLNWYEEVIADWQDWKRSNSSTQDSVDVP